ncbi:MAG: hypothetical protein AAFW69_07945, partial [Pseudomonadota bacterium]
SGFVDDPTAAISAIAAEGAADFLVILEGGHTSDALSLAAWFDGVIKGVLSEIEPQVPIVVSCTTMPTSFVDIEDPTPIDFTNRALVDQLRTLNNRVRLIYGDWGSTRPRSRERRGGGPTPARIDLPHAQSWWIARAPGDPKAWREVAGAIVTSEAWHGTNVLKIWGEQMISLTQENPSVGINTPMKNVASRVNIHLHLQAFYGYTTAQLSQLNLDEPWSDDEL